MSTRIVPADCDKASIQGVRATDGGHSLTRRLGQIGWLHLLCLAVLAAGCGLSGCSRPFYRRQADREAYGIVAQKSNDPRWAVPGFHIEVDPRSRYYDPYDPDRPPMPPDDPASHEYMHWLDSKRGYPHWHENGDRIELENPRWEETLGQYTELTEDGAVKLDLDGAVQLAYIHSPDWRQQLETIYLSALDVSTERFRFDAQFFGGTGTTATHLGEDRPGGEANILRQDTDAQMRRRFITGGELLVGFANSFVWQFAGPDTSNTNSIINFSLIQPLLRAGGRVVVLEQLTIVERALLANLRALERFRHGFYTGLAVGDQIGGGPRRQGGFFGGTGLTGFTGQGQGGFGGVGGGQFGLFGGGAAGGGGTGGGGGQAGGGAGTVGGFVGLLQQQQQIRNTRASLDLQLRTLQLLEANLQAGLIDITQVDLFRQQIETNRANLLTAENGLEFALDQFKTGNLGLPPDLPVDLDDSMIQQFQFVDARMTEIQNRFGDLIDRVGDLPAQPEVGAVAEALAQLELLSGEVAQRFPLVDASLKLLESRMEGRRRFMSPVEIRLFESEMRVLAATLPEFEARYQAMVAALSALRAELAPDTAARVTDGLVALASDLSNLTQELSLVQARGRVESVLLEPVELDPRDAFRIARANRLDWMNNRAALVDTWRLIAFNANALRSNLSVTFNGDIQTVGNNPVKFQAPTGILQAGLQFDAPFTRLLERNNYRSVLISYQQNRRQLIQFEDGIYQGLRQQLRTLELLEVNLENQRRQVVIALRRVDQTRENLSEPPPPAEPGVPPTALGPTAARDLLSALDDLSASQNNFMSVWLRHFATRMALMRDLGIMQLDERGIWIDIPLEQAIVSAEEVHPLPPAVPDEWLRDAGVDPHNLELLPGTEETDAGEGHLPPPE